MTILPMDVAIVSRYTDLVESSWMILLVLMLEILNVILPTADTSVGVFPPGHVSPDVFVSVVVSMKTRVGAEDCPTTSVLVGRNAGMEGVPDKQVDGWVEINGEALPHGLGTPACQEIPTAIEVFSCPLVWGSSTWLNIVEGGDQWLSTGLSISRPSNMSHVVMVTNSPMAWHNSLTLSAKGKLLGLLVDEPFPPNTVNTDSRLQWGALAFAVHLGTPTSLVGRLLDWGI